MSAALNSVQVASVRRTAREVRQRAGAVAGLHNLPADAFALAVLSEALADGIFLKIGPDANEAAVRAMVGAMVGAITGSVVDRLAGRVTVVP